MGKQVYHHRLSTSPFFSRQILEQTRTHTHTDTQTEAERVQSVKRFFVSLGTISAFETPAQGNFFSSCLALQQLLDTHFTLHTFTPTANKQGIPRWTDQICTATGKQLQYLSKVVFMVDQ